METNERVLVKADIREVPSEKRKKIKICYLIVVAALLVIGLIAGYGTSHIDGGTNIYGNDYPASDSKWYGWFDVRFYYYDSSVCNTFTIRGIKYTRYHPVTKVYNENIIWVSIMFIVLLGAPFYIDAIHKRQCKNTTLSISESKVYGSYNSFLFKKSLEMPIEKVDNLTTVVGLLDKLRTGATLGVCSASGIIKLHFIQNAEEIVSVAMNQIDKIKEKEKKNSENPQAVEISTLTSDKLKDLLAMKESGMITEDEFTKKREELLSNM